MSIPVTVLLPSDEKLEALRAFCESAGLQLIAPTDLLNPKQLDQTLRTPTPAFKSLCGAFWLTPKGKISTSGAYDFLKQYAHHQKLAQPDGTVQLDAELRAVFPTEATRVYPHELVKLAELALLPAN